MINFRKPLIIEKNYDWGQSIERSIVYIARMDYLQETKCNDRNLCWTETVQYKYYFKIDLWLIVLQFKWLSKIKKDENTKSSSNS